MLTGYFDANNRILHFPKFQKNILIALNARNPNFGIIKLYIHFKLTWFNKSVTPNKESIDLISFKDLIIIRSFKEELKDCDQFWKLSSQSKNALFWSMSICYSLLKITGVEMWDQLFEHESPFIEKYGLDAYLEESMPPFHNPVPNFVKDEIRPPPPFLFSVFTREGTLGCNNNQ
ncbi:hypothetical protein RFI_37103 [Reticulomyxa filosa]|uniref:Uncharacterized protein n=1 Tax=Reticulomyxa filosa TaxID=46433 RepID=X6LFK7_RETFI|nr:hypothetical protein RFI_37103 [Reticulomyxa filosa]|eukprot:ETO00344.1 hypothetical protein RFI_37103 [Reticulomyxa filosa]